MACSAQRTCSGDADLFHVRRDDVRISRAVDAESRVEAGRDVGWRVVWQRQLVAAALKFVPVLHVAVVPVHVFAAVKVRVAVAGVVEQVDVVVQQTVRGGVQPYAVLDDAERARHVAGDDEGLAAFSEAVTFGRAVPAPTDDRLSGGYWISGGRRLSRG